MKTCPRCGTKNFDTEVKCGKCAYPLRVSPLETVVSFPQQNSGEQIFVVKRKGATTIQNIARAFMIVSCVTSVMCAIASFICLIVAIIASNVVAAIVHLITAFLFSIIAIIFICMTNNYTYKITNEIKVGTAFKIATLLLCNTIAGILMLCDETSN